MLFESIKLSLTGSNTLSGGFIGLKKTENYRQNHDIISDRRVLSLFIRTSDWLIKANKEPHHFHMSHYDPELLISTDDLQNEGLAQFMS